MLSQSKHQLVQRQRRSFHRKITIPWTWSLIPFISDLAMVFDVAVESEDTGIDGARSSTFDEGARQHPCEAEAEITSPEVDHFVV